MRCAAAADKLNLLKDQRVSFNNSQSCIVSGLNVMGSPWISQAILDFKESLEKAQAKHKTHPVKRAY